MVATRVNQTTYGVRKCSYNENYDKNVKYRLSFTVLRLGFLGNKLVMDPLGAGPWEILRGALQGGALR